MPWRGRTPRAPRHGPKIRNKPIAASTGTAIGLTSGAGRSRKVDAKDLPAIALVLHQRDDALRQAPPPPRPVPRSIDAASTAGVEQQHRIDVGGIVELATAVLAERNDGKPRTGSPGKRSAKAAAIASSSARSAKSDRVSVTVSSDQIPGQVEDRDDQRQCHALLAQCSGRRSPPSVRAAPASASASVTTPARRRSTSAG